MKATKWKKRHMGFNRNKVSFTMRGEKPFWKQKKSPNFADVFLHAWSLDLCSNYILMWKLEFLSSTVSVNLSVVALPIIPKVKFIFQIMLYIIIFLYESTAALNLWSAIKTHLKAHLWSSCFRGDTRKG